MAGKKRPDKNSTTALVNAFAQAGSGIDLPEGVQLSTEDERVLWEQFTRARAKQDWRDMDLLLIAKMVKLETDIRKHQQTLDEEGAIVTNQRGTQIENPLFRVIDTLQRQQLAIMRSMSLNQTGTDARTLNAGAKTVKQARDTLANLEGDEFIAMPPNRSM